MIDDFAGKRRLGLRFKNIKRQIVRLNRLHGREVKALHVRSPASGAARSTYMQGRSQLAGVKIGERRRKNAVVGKIEIARFACGFGIGIGVARFRAKCGGRVVETIARRRKEKVEEVTEKRRAGIRRAVDLRVERRL